MNAKEIEKYFNVILEEGAKAVAACVDKKIFAKYSKVPKELIKSANNETQETEKIETTEDQEKNKVEELQEHQEGQLEQVNNVDREALIRNKLKLINASLFIKQKNK